MIATQQQSKERPNFCHQNLTYNPVFLEHQTYIAIWSLQTTHKPTPIYSPNFFTYQSNPTQYYLKIFTQEGLGERNMKHVAGVLTILLLITISDSSDSLPSCDGIISELTPCISYLIGSQDNPSDTCCNGVRNVAKFSNSKSDRKAICQCLKNYALSHSGIDFSLVSTLPGKCQVNVKLPPISITFDCDK